jgi:NhaP-type Na+/H+ or K+/H+ antiporter
METSQVLVCLFVVVLAGVSITLACRRLKIPSAFFLILAGLLLGSLRHNGQRLVYFPQEYLANFGVMALCIVVFGLSMKFQWKEFDTLTQRASKMALIFFIMCLIVLGIGAAILFHISNLYLVIIFASLAAAFSPGIIAYAMRKKPFNGFTAFSGNSVCNVQKLLVLESEIIGPMAILIPFIVIGIMHIGIQAADAESHVAMVLQHFLGGLGAGIIMGIILFKIMRKYYLGRVTPILLIVSVIVTYLLAEGAGGNGIIAVGIFGLFFGKVYVKGKKQIYLFIEALNGLLGMLLFVLVGISVSMPADSGFYAKAAMLFALYLLVRWVSANAAYAKSPYSDKEKLLMALDAPHGLPMAAALLCLFTLSLEAGNSGAVVQFSSFPGAKEILGSMLVFLLLSQAVSLIINIFCRGKICNKEH